MKNRGISLIVLVITIIIIIILAGAVILSLSNSNVINKAKSGILQTDVSTIKEQIKTKMAENELDGINTKIGTQLWDSFYTMSVSQLQEIGISAKNHCIYDYNTGNLSIKQNNDYVTPEELYARDSATNYIEGYITLNFKNEEISEEVTDAKIASETDPTIKAALQRQQLAQKYTNSGIKVSIYDVDLAAFTDSDEQNKAIANPKYSTQLTNNGYFIINNITVETGKPYYIIINNNENIVGVFQTIDLSSYINKMIFTKAEPLKLYIGDLDNTYSIDGIDAGELMSLKGTESIKKYDLNKDGKIEVDQGEPDYNILMGISMWMSYEEYIPRIKQQL